LNVTFWRWFARVGRPLRDLSVCMTVTNKLVVWALVTHELSAFDKELESSDDDGRSVALRPDKRCQQSNAIDCKTLSKVSKDEPRHFGTHRTEHFCAATHNRKLSLSNFRRNHLSKRSFDDCQGARSIGDNLSLARLPLFLFSSFRTVWGHWSKVKLAPPILSSGFKSTAFVAFSIQTNISQLSILNRIDSV
jgi:hypothetical protein